MNFTFGVCCSPQTKLDHFIKLYHSIVDVSKTLVYSQLLIIGELTDNVKNYVYLVAKDGPIKMGMFPFPDDHENSKGWITKKKNILVEFAAFENTCLLHDYYELPPDFSFHIPRKYDVYCAPIVTKEGHRHSDWVVSPNAMDDMINQDPVKYSELLMSVNPKENAAKYVCGVPYEIPYLWPIQYVSGGLITARTEVLRDIPFNEDLRWGDAEDVEWSARLVKKYKLTCTAWNGQQKVKVNKANKWAVAEMPTDFIISLRKFYGL